MSYVPLKTKFENIVLKISEKVFKLEPSYLVYWLGLMSRWPDQLLRTFRQILTKIRNFEILIDFSTFRWNLKLLNGEWQGFEISYTNSSWKNSWPVLFSCSSYAPFWSYAPFKTKFENLVCKIPEKVFKLEPSYLVYWLGLKRRSPD